jgi:DNA-binding CsgD family transcriptional regulator
MAKGRSNREIAEILSCSEATVKFHISGLFKRLNAANRAEAIAIAARQGWLMN